MNFGGFGSEHADIDEATFISITQQLELYCPNRFDELYPKTKAQSYVLTTPPPPPQLGIAWIV